MKKKGFLSFCNFNDTLFDQKSPVPVVLGPAGGDKQTDKQTHGHVNYRLKWPSERFCEKKDVKNEDFKSSNYVTIKSSLEPPKGRFSL